MVKLDEKELWEKILSGLVTMGYCSDLWREIKCRRYFDSILYLEIL